MVKTTTVSDRLRSPNFRSFFKQKTAYEMCPCDWSSDVCSSDLAGSTPGGALPSIPLSFSLATILPPEPKDFDFS